MEHHLTSTKSDTAVCELSQIWFTHACPLRPSLFQLSVFRYNGRWLLSHQAGTWLQCSVTFGARIRVCVYACMHVTLHSSLCIFARNILLKWCKVLYSQLTKRLHTKGLYLYILTMVVLADQNITKIYLPIRNYIINQTSWAWVKIGAVKSPTFHMAMNEVTFIL